MDDRPIRATWHCRHYRYQPGVGPICGMGRDISGATANKACMPLYDGHENCPLREDYTDAEREAWAGHQKEQFNRIGVRNTSFSDPVPCNSSQQFPCACGNGTMRVQRGRKRAYINCSCDLSPIELNLGTSGEWPKKGKADG